jgi:hypothetical protein
MSADPELDPEVEPKPVIGAEPEVEVVGVARSA